MEVFFNNLVADESAAEKLLHDLSLASEGAQDLFEAGGADLPAQAKEQFLSRLEQVKAACRDFQAKALSGAKAADRAIREHPYSVAGVAFGLGLVIGALALRRSADDEAADCED